MLSNIKSLEVLDEEMEMCEITVDDVHCYFANGFLTHNCAQELRVPANLTLDPSFVRAFTTPGGDPHTATAIEMFGEENYDKEKRKIAKCLVGSTRIPVDDKGLIRISDLCSNRKEDHFVEHYDRVFDDGEKRETSHFYYNGRSETIRLVTDKGYVIEGSRRHPMWTPSGFKCLCDFKVGDELVVSKPEEVRGSIQSIKYNPWGEHVSENSPVVYLTEDYALLCGLLLGDGTINDKACYLMWSSVFSDLTAKYSHLLYRLGLDHRIVYDVGRGKKPLNQVVVGSTRFVKFLKQLEIVKDGHKQLAVPDWVFRSTMSIRRAFLRGLFETDGSVSCKKVNEYVEFCARSMDFARDVQLLLSSVGVLSIVRPSYNKVYDRSYYKVRVYKSQLKMFEPIGFLSETKQAKFASIDKTGVKESPSIYRAKVIEIHYGEAELFDLTVPGSHRFTANGLLSSNTFNFGILYGMSTYSVADRYHVPLETAEKWVNLYKSAHRTIFSWVDQITKQAVKKGTVYNYFGRPRRVKYWFASPNPKDRAFAYRTVVNTSIQSVGADMTKLALIKYYKNVFNNPHFIDPDGHHWAEFRETIHDEIGCVIDKIHAEEVIAACVKSQRLKLKGWPVPMDIGLELGNTWGCMFPFKVNQDTGEVLEPDGELVNGGPVEKTEKIESSDVEEELSISFDDF